MKVLLTGASGFIGSHILQSLLHQQTEVIAVSRRRPNISGNYHWLEADILAEAPDRFFRDNNISHVVHTAWYVEHGKFWTDAANKNWRETTIALATSAATFGVGRFVSLGTCYEYDWPLDDDCDEIATPIVHHTPYDTAKTGARIAVEDIAARTGMSFCWPRLFFPFGPGETTERLIPFICQSLARGIPANCSIGTKVRDFIAVSDAAQMLAELSVSNIAGCVNIATGQPVTIAEVALCLGRLSGRPDLIRLGAIPERGNDPPRIAAKLGRITMVPAFSTIPSLEQRLDETYNFWKTQTAS